VGTGAAAEIAELFSAGMSKVYLLPMNDLNLATALEGHESDFFTILIARSDWADADINATQASGNITITSYANLLTTAADTVSVAGVAFTAQSGAATLGTATFRAATGNTETAASLAAQINAHPTTSALVTRAARLSEWSRSRRSSQAPAATRSLSATPITAAATSAPRSRAPLSPAATASTWASSRA
jgi:hypothetical protein